MPNVPRKKVTLDRYFSKKGVMTRSQATEAIRSGRVTVNSAQVLDPSIWVDPNHDEILLQHSEVTTAELEVYLVNKPKGCLCTHSDDRRKNSTGEISRKTIFEILPDFFQRLHSAGRLDQATSGAILFTNSNQFSHFITEPKFKIKKIYLVTVRGLVTPNQVDPIVQKGLLDQGELLMPESITIRKSSNRETHLVVTLTEGKNREIRRIFDALHHPVTHLKRAQLGPFTLENLPPGGFRRIPIGELKVAFPSFDFDQALLLNPKHEETR